MKLQTNPKMYYSSVAIASRNTSFGTKREFWKVYWSQLNIPHHLTAPFFEESIKTPTFFHDNVKNLKEEPIGLDSSPLNLQKQLTHST